MAKLHLLLEVWVLHRVIELIILLAHLVVYVLLLAHVEDAHLVALAIVSRSILTAFRRNDLNVAVARQKFHIRRAIKKHFSRNRRKCISQVSQLFIAVSEAAVLSKLAHTCLLEVAAHLCLVVRVHSSNVVPAGVGRRHRLK